MSNKPIPVTVSIHSLRGLQVMLDTDLAALYKVTTSALNQAVKRNKSRFPEDFMFHLTDEEFEYLRSQSVIASGHGGRRTLPYAFTEHGVTMAAAVLNSERAIQMSIMVVREFVKLRREAATIASLAAKLRELEKRHDVHDSQIQTIFDALKRMLKEPQASNRQIGFRSEKNKKTGT